METAILLAIVSFLLGVLLMSLLVAGREADLVHWGERARVYPTVQGALRWADRQSDGRDPARVPMPTTAVARPTASPSANGRGKLGMRHSAR